MMFKIVNIFYRFKPYYWLSNLYKLEKKHIINGVFKIADEVIDERRRKQALPAIDDSVSANDAYTKKSLNFITTLTDPSNGLTEEEIWHEINTIIAAVINALHVCDHN